MSSPTLEIVGFRAPDKRFVKMRSVWNACEEANIPIPGEVVDFFGEDPPDSKGLSQDMKKHDCVSEYAADMKEGFEVNISKLPGHITHLRFFVSY